MSSNPFREETTEVIEGLQPRPVPQTPAPQPQPQPQAQASYPVQAVSAPPQATDGEGETRDREDALTIKFAIGKLNDYLQWFLMVLESILAIRFLLRMFGADPNNLFARFIFALTDILLVPFNNILPNVSLHTNQAFEFSTIFAAAIYFLIFFALKRFLHILISNPEEPVE